MTPFRLPVPIVSIAALLLLAGHALQPGAQSTPQEAGSVDPAALHVPTPQIFGFRDFTQQAKWDADFMAVPDPRLAQQHLKALTAAPHWASSPEDYATALYVAARFKAAGLQTEIVPYSVLLSKPISTLVEASDRAGIKILTGPTREHVDLSASPAADQFQNDPRILPAFHSSSPSADITAPVIYANYGRLADFQRLADLGVSVKGKIALVRYGGAYRGVKVYIAQQFGVRGVLIYSDPADDGSKTPEAYPAGRDRPASAVQRGSVQFLPIYPGDPTTPGVASVPQLPASQRIAVNKLQYDVPSIPSNPLSSADATPILRAMDGPDAPHDWQGGLAFPYHLGGSGAVTVHMRLVSDTRLRTIWNVIGKLPGSTDPHHWVIAGNHRDAWVYGAADPNSGTAAMLETVHGLGVLLQHGWKPRRTIVMASWDAEEEGIIGSTEWVEQHPAELENAVAYFNVDVAVSGTEFNAAAVPSLRQFVREIAAEVPSAARGTVSEQWKKQENQTRRHRDPTPTTLPGADVPPLRDLPLVGDLGSGSDYTPFLQHAGVPSTDIGSDGPFSVYHSVYDNYDWFVRFVDPTFAYTQQQARFFGLEILHMADADVLPFDYTVYAQEIIDYLSQARSRATGLGMKLDFISALAAASQFESAAQAIHQRQIASARETAALDRSLNSVERAFLIPAGLPRRPWYRHSIYAPGEFTGYEAVVIPGVNEAIDAADPLRAQGQLDALAQALTRAATALAPAKR